MTKEVFAKPVSCVLHNVFRAAHHSVCPHKYTPDSNAGHIFTLFNTLKIRLSTYVKSAVLFKHINLLARDAGGLLGGNRWKRRNNNMFYISGKQKILNMQISVFTMSELINSTRTPWLKARLNGLVCSSILHLVD